MSQSTHPTTDRLGDPERGLATPKAGQTRSYWWWLLRKEAKQLAPLLIALVACGFVLHLLGLIGREYHSFHGVSLIMVPFLFAIGAGPMLVSQEKEQRTLGWIGSLPVNPRSIILSKFVVCVLGLVLAWMVSVGMFLLLNSAYITTSEFRQMEPLGWLCGTFFLLSMGFASAWMFSTAVSSLIALTVACCVTAILGKIVLSAIVDDTDALRGPLETTGLGLFGLAAAVATIFFGQRAFVATSVFSRAFWRSERRPQYASPQLWTLSPSSSLIWQIGRQNSFIWSGLFLIVALSGALFLFYNFNKPTEADLLLSILLPIGLVLSWLGASVFGSDAYRQRINFLAQRGVAPGLIWWTRMILPLGSVILCLTGFIFLLWLPPAYQPFRTDDLSVMDFSIAIVGVLTIFGFTQWFAQWTRSTLIGFCVAPAVAAMTVGYQIFVISGLEAPWWIFLPSFGVAMLATRVMIYPWMDGRFDWRYWTSHGALMLLALAIPLIPFLYTWVTHPDMSPTMKQALTAEVEDYLLSPRPGDVDLVSNRHNTAADDDTTVPEDFATANIAKLDAMQRELSEIEGPIAMPGNKFAISTADLMSLRMDAMADSDSSNDRKEMDRKRYRQVMVLLNDLVRHLRLSERIQEQDYADVIERWMVSELSKPGRQEFLTAGQYARIVARLSDQDARYQARRRAIVMAWEKSKSNPRNELRNDAAAKAHAPWGPKSLVVQRDISIATAHLLDRLESSVPMPITYPGELDSIELGDLPTRGMLWYRPWETQAKQLSKALKSTPKTKGSNDE